MQAPSRGQGCAYRGAWALHLGGGAGTLVASEVTRLVIVTRLVNILCHTASVVPDVGRSGQAGRRVRTPGRASCVARRGQRTPGRGVEAGRRGPLDVGPGSGLARYLLDGKGRAAPVAPDSE